MLVVIGALFIGVISGYFLQKKKTLNINKPIMVLICILLFILGVEVGENETILQNFDTIGVEALIITGGAVLGSILLSWLLWYFVQHKAYGKNER